MLLPKAVMGLLENDQNRLSNHVRLSERDKVFFDKCIKQVNITKNIVNVVASHLFPFIIYLNTNHHTKNPICV